MSSVVHPHTLRFLRRARGWDQRHLARAAGIDPSVVSRLERGLQEDVAGSVLLALARALGTSVDALLLPPEGYRTPGLALEVAVVVEEVKRRPLTQQQQIAAILRTVLAALPVEE